MRKLLLMILGIVFLPIMGHAAQGVAILKGTAPDSKISGQVTFKEENGGLTVVANVANAPLGKHGFHIHAVGNCADLGMDAGGHFNPDKSIHGLWPRDGVMKAQAGDMGNIDVAADGSGNFKTFMPMLTLTTGKYAVGGLSVIVHQKEDDFSQPVGHAGSRIACGIIEVQK